MEDRRFLNNLAKATYKTSVFTILRERARMEAADYAEQRLDTAMLFENLPQLWNYAASSVSLKGGLFLEFGVFKGKSINHFSKIF
ncbi:MAG: hypothetical protein ACI9KK_001913 [Ascidiaceihabitans sp.]|jgi:hypothetical protein